LSSEHAAFNQGVPGSIPGRLTKSFSYFRHQLALNSYVIQGGEIRVGDTVELIPERNCEARQGKQ
jgi:hypothetical protein